MKKLWIWCGRVAFYTVWPAVFMYVFRSVRTRVVIECQGKILLTQGWLGSGKWVLPGGGLHAGEVWVEGAAREVYEETGIQLDPLRLRPLGSFRTAKGFRFTAAVFSVQLDAQPAVRPQPREIASLAWVDPMNIPKTISLDESSQRAIDTWRGVASAASLPGAQL